VFVPYGEQQRQTIAAVGLKSYSGEIISDHDRALLDALDSPKPHKGAFSAG